MKLKPSTILYFTNNDRNTMLRSPIVCIIGHVDSGKTSVMDILRGTHVQTKEYGGITQQLGTTYFDKDLLLDMVSNNPLQDKREKYNSLININGILFLDTPGHSCFKAIRKMGMDICDIAILIVDFHKSLEKGALENITYLRKIKKPFIIAANKIDKIYEWKSDILSPIKEVIKKQSLTTTSDFQKHTRELICDLAIQELNAKLFYEIDDYKSWVSIIPISAKTGEGMADLLKLLIELSQRFMTKKLIVKEETDAVIIESNKNYVDIILISGELHIGDEVILHNGKIITNKVHTIAILENGRELKNKGRFKTVNHITASCSARITFKDKVISMISGGHIYLNTLAVGEATNNTDENKNKLEEEYKNNVDELTFDKYGITIIANNNGILHGIYELCREEKIPVFQMSTTLTKEISVKHNAQLERLNDKDEMDKYNVILMFVQDEMKDTDSILYETTVYKLIDKYKKFQTKWLQSRKEKYKNKIIKPFICEILPEHIYSVSKPIRIGVKVLEGMIRNNCIVAAYEANIIVGKITSMRVDDKNVSEAVREVCINLEPINKVYTYDDSFDRNDVLYSFIDNDNYDKTIKYGELNAQEIKLIQRLLAYSKLVGKN